MGNLMNTPAEIVEANIKSGEGKGNLPMGRMILMGMLAGAFIAIGGAASNTAAHAIENVGVARAVAGSIFGVGLMLVVFMGAELFTGNCLMITSVMDKKITWAKAIRNLVIVYFSNLLGALIFHHHPRWAIRGWLPDVSLVARRTGQRRWLGS